MTKSATTRGASKPDDLRELGPVDISAIRGPILNIPERLWDAEDARKENAFSVFDHTRHIVFRFIQGNHERHIFYSEPLWQLWERKLMPVMLQAVAPYDFHEPIFPKVMLARLAAGHVIDPHVDGAGSNLTTHKIHLPLKTNPDALMSINGRSFHLAEGHAYEVNNVVIHGVENRGAEDRIHLIFEVFDGAGA